MLALPLALLVAGGVYWWSLQGKVTTDNAYVQQDKVSVGAEVGGRIVAVMVKDGQMVRAGDLVAPRLVRRGEAVTLSLQGRGFAITTAARALAAGGMGDVVRVVALSTNRSVDGVVTGAGSVRVAAQ